MPVTFHGFEKHHSRLHDHDDHLNTHTMHPHRGVVPVRTNHKLKKPDSRLKQRGEWDRPEKNKALKEKAEKVNLFQLEDLANSHQIVHHLAKRTHFNSDQVKALINIYKRLTSLGKMDRLRFREILYSTFNITDDIILDRTFGAFDGDNQGNVSEIEWVIGMSCFLRGTLDEKIAYCYEVYDINGDRNIGREEVHSMLRHCINPIPGAGNSGIDPEECADASKDIADMVVQRLDVDRNGVITFGDFHDACTRDPNMLESLGSCLPSVQQLKTFLILFADDYTVFSTNYSHPGDEGWDRERDKFARKESITTAMKHFDRSITGIPLLSYRDRQKHVQEAMKGKKRSVVGKKKNSQEVRKSF